MAHKQYTHIRPATEAEIASDAPRLTLSEVRAKRDQFVALLMTKPLAVRVHYADQLQQFNAVVEELEDAYTKGTHA